MAFAIVESILVGDQHFLVLAVPAAGSVFVGPAEAEGEIGLARAEDLSDGPLQQLLAAEPVVVEAEGMDAVLAGEIGLLLTVFRKALVVIAEVCG